MIVRGIKAIPLTIIPMIFFRVFLAPLRLCVFALKLVCINVHFRGWADLPAQRQGEIWPAKRQIILRNLRGRSLTQRRKAAKILTADYADYVDFLFFIRVI